MKKSFLILAVLLLATPFLSFADAYMGPFCYENPANYSNQSYDDDPNHIRGTCKTVEMTSIISLDTSLQNDYFLALHDPISLFCDEEGILCDKTKYSEIINLDPTITALTFDREDVTREYESDSFGKGQKEYIHPNTAILLDKKYVLDYLSSVYKQSGIKLENNKFPLIFLVDRNEIKKIAETNSKDGFVTFPPLFFNGRNDPILYTGRDGNPFNHYSPSIYIFDHLNFGKHIFSLKGSLRESNYLDLDKTKLPPQDIKPAEDYGRRWVGIVYEVPITSPIKSVKNYWIFTKKDGKVVLVWQKSEYGLDNGKIDIAYNDNIKVTSTAPPPTTNNVTATSTDIAISSTTNNVPATLPTEQKNGFFSRLLDFILSWFK